MQQRQRLASLRGKTHNFMMDHFNYLSNAALEPGQKFGDVFFCFIFVHATIQYHCSDIHSEW